MRQAKTFFVAILLLMGNAQAWEPSLSAGGGVWIPRGATREAMGAPQVATQLGVGVSNAWIAARLDAGFVRTTSALRGVDSGRASGERQTLWFVDIAPGVELTCCARFWIRPFVRAAHVFQVFSIEDPYDHVRGLKQGLAGSVGTTILLDRALNSSDPFDVLGLSHVFLDLTARNLHPWTQGVDLGGWTFGGALGASF